MNERAVQAESYLQHRGRMENSWNKAKVAYGIALPLVLGGLAFPPSGIAGFVIALEGTRQVLKMNLELLRYDNQRTT